MRVRLDHIFRRRSDHCHVTGSAAGRELGRGERADVGSPRATGSRPCGSSGTRTTTSPTAGRSRRGGSRMARRGIRLLVFSSVLWRLSRRARPVPIGNWGRGSLPPPVRTVASATWTRRAAVAWFATTRRSDGRGAGRGRRWSSHARRSWLMSGYTRALPELLVHRQSTASRHRALGRGSRRTTDLRDGSAIATGTARVVARPSTWRVGTALSLVLDQRSTSARCRGDPRRCAIDEGRRTASHPATSSPSP